MTQLANPITLTNIRNIENSPEKANVKKRNTRRILPSNWRYVDLSDSLIEGRPANSCFLLEEYASAKSMSNPPATDKFLKKNCQSKKSPYPIHCDIITAPNPAQAYSVCFLKMARADATNMTTTLEIKNISDKPQENPKIICGIRISSPRKHCLTLMSL